MAINLDEAILTENHQSSSQYSVLFSGVDSISDNKQTISLRLKGGFKIPTKTYTTFNVYHKNRVIPKISQFEEFEKKLTLEMYIDGNWDVYDQFYKWQALIEKGSKKVKKAELLVTAENTTQVSIQEFSYKGVKLLSIDISEFNYETGDPISMVCEFIFNDFTSYSGESKIARG